MFINLSGRVRCARQSGDTRVPRCLTGTVGFPRVEMGNPPDALDGRAGWMAIATTVMRLMHNTRRVAGLNPRGCWPTTE
jgi:hypothetical protein